MKVKRAKKSRSEIVKKSSGRKIRDIKKVCDHNLSIRICQHPVDYFLQNSTTLAILHSIPAYKKQSYKKRLVDMAIVKKRQLVEINLVKKRISYSK